MKELAMLGLILVLLLRCGVVLRFLGSPLSFEE